MNHYLKINIEGTDYNHVVKLLEECVGMIKNGAGECSGSERTNDYEIIGHYDFSCHSKPKGGG